MLMQRLPTILATLLLLLIAGILFMQVQPLLQDQARQDSLASLPQVEPNELENQTRTRFDISRFDLFGQVGAVTEAAPVEVPEELPETTLQLKLTGILAAEDDTLTGALIEGPDRETSNYKPGDALPGNATLKQVHPDRVVIERAGRFENLYFPAEFSSGGFAAYAPPVQDEIATYDYTQNDMIPAEDISTSQVSEARKASIKERLSQLRNRLMNQQ